VVVGVRLFVAAPLTDEARMRIAHALEEASPLPLPGRPVRPENWHITMRFLGEVGEVERDLVIGALDRADLGDAFRLRWSGLGAFPRPQRATVLWLGLDRGEGELADLAGRVEEALEGAGFAPEDRPFRSHLTLSRIRPHQDLTPLLEAFDPVCFEMGVDRVVLYRSHLGPGGARYEEVEVFPLG
jgi:2'-5' RNA ligase